MIPERLRSLIKEKKLTLKEFGSKFNLAESTISGYVTGSRKPDIELIEKFASFFDVHPDYLRGKTDYRNKVQLVEKWQEVIENAKQAPAVKEQSATGGLAYYGGPDRYTDEEKASSAAKRKAIMEKYPDPAPLAFIQFSDGSIEELTPDEEGHMDKQLKMYRLLKEQEGI